MNHGPVESGDRLRALLQRAALQPEQLGYRLNAFAAQLGIPARVHPKTTHKWLRGCHPREPWPALAAAVLGRCLNCEVQVEDIGWRSKSGGLIYVPADSGLVVPWTGSGTIAATTEVAETSMIDRRVFLSISGAALTQPALEWLIAKPAADLTGTVGKRVLDSDVDTIETMIAQLRKMDDRFGGGTALKVVKGQVQFVLELLRNHQYSSTVGTRLHVALGELLRLTGFMSFDMTDHPQAQRLFIAGLHAAHTGGDRALGANILGFMSHVAEELEMPGEAVRLAEAARNGYPGASPRVSAILDMRAARAYGEDKDVRQCREAIEGAYSHLRDTPPDGGDPVWSYWLDESGLNLHAGECYLHLGDWANAQHHLTTAIRLCNETWRRRGAMARAHLAYAYVQQRQPDRAVDLATRAVDMLANEVTSARAANHVRRVQDALKPYHKMPAVREFHDRTNQLLGTPT